MKKALLGIAFVFIGLSDWLVAQEVVTDQTGQKIVVDSNGQWTYFQREDSVFFATPENVYQLPKSNADERRLRLSDSQQLERELTLALIRERVQLVDLQLALMESTGITSINLKEQLAQTEQRAKQLENELNSVKNRTEFLLKIGSLPAPVERRPADRLGVSAHNPGSCPDL